MNKKKFYLWLVPTLLWLAVIFGHSAMNASASSKESLELLGKLQELFPWLTHDILRKIGHFAEFSVLGFFLMGCFWNYKDFRIIKPLRSALLVGLYDETLQIFIEGRSAQVVDVWIDFAGALCGCLFLWAILKLQKK